MFEEKGEAASQQREVDYFGYDGELGTRIDGQSFSKEVALFVRKIL